MSDNPEILLVKALELLGLPVALSVPNPRPPRFLTVERVGGGYEGISARMVDRPLIAVQCWAETREQASQLAEAASSVLRAVKSCHVHSIVNFPDEKQPRYQITCQIVMRPKP